MTREEAVKGLDRLKTIIWKESNMQIALNMAIEALEQEPCEDKRTDKRTGTHACDCISRQAAIDAVGKAMPQLTTPDGCGEFDHEIQIAAEAFSDCMKIINDLSSAQPERAIKEAEK